MNGINSLGFWLDIASYAYVLNFLLFGAIALFMSVGITIQAKRHEAVIYCLLEMIKFVGLSFSAGFSPIQSGLVISRTVLGVISPIEAIVLLLVISRTVSYTIDINIKWKHRCNREA